MKKRLTEAQFQGAIKGLDVGPQTRRVAHGVLVEGKTQAEFATRLDITKGAVWQAVNRVWDRAQTPEGYQRVTAVLPEHQAFIVRKWAEEARKKREAQ